MIEYKTKNGVRELLRITGDIGEISVEIAALINEIYFGIKKGNERVAEKFKHNIIQSVISPSSPLWEREAIKKEEV